MSGAFTFCAFFAVRENFLNLSVSVPEHVPMPITLSIRSTPGTATTHSRVFIMVSKEWFHAPVTIPVKTTASGASFLMTAAMFNNFVFSRNQSTIARTTDIGKLEVIYADGETATIPITRRLNINDWNTYLGGALCRAVVRGNDRNGSLFSLYAIDWRNPHPDKEIKEIVFSSKGDTGISPVLFAISLSDAAKTPAGVAGTPPTSFPKPERPAAKKTVALDFSGTTHKIAISEFGMKGLSCGTVSDSRRGNVLEIRIPRTRKFLSRAVIDIWSPKAPPTDFESVVFDIKTSGWNGITVKALAFIKSIQ